MVSPRSAARAFLARALPAAVLLLIAPPAPAQSYAIGAGASVVNDQGTLVSPKDFSHWSSNLFGELSIGEAYTRHRVAFQIRWCHFPLPGGVADAPDVNVDAGLFAVSYVWREEWWEAGFIGGGGVYAFQPKDPNPGQVRADPSQTVVGLWGGLVTTFRVSRQFDFRLELTGHLPRSDYSHTPLFLTMLVGYRF